MSTADRSPAEPWNLARFTCRPQALYSAAAMRIGLGSLFLFLLVRELPNADALWGPGSAWTPEMNRDLAERYDWSPPTRMLYGLLATDSYPLFYSLYGLAILVSLLFVLGWRTRAVAVLFALAVLAVCKRNILAGDSSERVVLILAVYLVFVASGRRWSLDARRLRRQLERGSAPRYVTSHGAGEELRRRIVCVLHNAGFVLICAQMALIYCSAALAKVRSEAWQEGSALYVTLQREWWRPWPELNDVAAGQGTALWLFTYATIFTQLAFAFVIFNRRLRHPMLLIMLGFHIGIALMMGLTYFSWAMAVGDLAFLSDRFWLGLRERLAVRRQRRRTGRSRDAPPSEPAAARGDGMDVSPEPAAVG